MVLHPIPQSLPVHFFGSRPQPPTSRRLYSLSVDVSSRISNIISFVWLFCTRAHFEYHLFCMALLHTSAFRISSLLYGSFAQERISNIISFVWLFCTRAHFEYHLFCMALLHKSAFHSLSLSVCIALFHGEGGGRLVRFRWFCPSFFLTHRT